MGNVREIKGRIKSVKNTTKITRTMELVATAKAKGAVNRIERAIPYFDALQEIATEARGQGGVSNHPLLIERPVKSVAVLAIAYDQRLALGIGAVHAGLVMLSLELNPAFGLVLMVGIATMVWQLDAVRTRSKIVRTGAFTGLAMAAATLVVSLATQPLGVEGPYQLIAIDTLGSLISGLAVGVVVQAVLPGLERIFKVTTAMTLKELNDASHPLLQRLAPHRAARPPASRHARPRAQPHPLRRRRPARGPPRGT